MQWFNDMRAGLKLLSKEVRPLLGGTIEGISFYEHIATVYHRPTNQLFVAYQSASVPVASYALWAVAKRLRVRRGTELERRFGNQTRKVYIEKMTSGRGRRETIQRLSDWLEAIEDDAKFTAIVCFLIEHKILDREISAIRGRHLTEGLG
jgi:hypothetical protein